MQCTWVRAPCILYMSATAAAVAADDDGQLCTHSEHHDLHWIAASYVARCHAESLVTEYIVDNVHLTKCINLHLILIFVELV